MNALLFTIALAQPAAGNAPMRFEVQQGFQVVRATCPSCGHTFHVSCPDAASQAPTIVVRGEPVGRSSGYSSGVSVSVGARRGIFPLFRRGGGSYGGSVSGGYGGGMTRARSGGG